MGGAGEGEGELWDGDDLGGREQRNKVLMQEHVPKVKVIQPGQVRRVRAPVPLLWYLPRLRVRGASMCTTHGCPSVVQSERSFERVVPVRVGTREWWWERVCGVDAC